MHFQFEKALKIFLQTYPFVLLRLGVSLAVLALTVGWWVSIYYLFMAWPFPGPSWLAWVIGGILFGSGIKWIRRYFLYLVKAGHVSVITCLAVDGNLPAGSDQISYGTQTVFRHFVRVSVLFAVDQLVRVVLKAFNRSVFKLISFIPGSGGLRNFSQRVLDYSLGYIDEAILSFTLLHSSRNPWTAARDGLILYVQNWKTILGTGFVLALASYAIVGAIGLPGVILAWTVPTVAGKISGGILAGMALVVKFAVVDPFALTAVIVNYHDAIAGQQADSAWAARLEEVSGEFKQFGQKAREWATPAAQTPPQPPAPV